MAEEPISRISTGPTPEMRSQIAEPFGGQPPAGISRPLPRTREFAISEGMLTIVALAVIVILAGVLRLTAINWDDGNGLHPDERHIVDSTSKLQIPGSIGAYFNTDTSSLNTYNREVPSFVYGTVPIFLGKIGAAVSGPLGVGPLDFGERDSYQGLYSVGRALSGLADIGTVIFVFFIAKRLFGSRAGLLAALMYAFAALPIQHSHFFVVDAFMTCFAAGAVYYAIRIVQDGRWRDYALAGLFVGLATASKLTAVSLMPVVGLAGFVRAWPAIEPVIGDMWRSRPRASSIVAQGARMAFGRALLGIGLSLVVAFIIFRIGQPYAFQTPGVSDVNIVKDDFACEQKCGGLTEGIGQVLNLNPEWVQDQTNQQNLLKGSSSWPPNVQWIGRTPWLYPLQQMIVWGLGPALGIAGWLGFFNLASRVVRKRELVLIVPLVWVAGYFLFMGGQFTLYMRYFLPLYPALTVFAAALVMAMLSWAAKPSLPEPATRWLSGLSVSAREIISNALPAAVRTIAVAVPVLTILWGLAFFHIYSEPVTRIQASSWFYANVPQGSTIGHEHWDDPVPYALPGIGDGAPYTHLTFDNFEGDTPEKVDKLVQNLDAVDYIILSSTRLSKTIPRAPAIWPVTVRYYDTLFNGELGFDLVHKETSSPSVLGIEIPDVGAEEAWTVYDHPPVYIFQKTPSYSHDRAVAVLGADSFVPGVNMTPEQAAKNALLLRPDDLKVQQEGGTFSDIFDEDSISNKVPLWAWLFVFEVISLSVLPIVLLLFRGLPDRGYLLSKPLGFLTLGYVVWLGASLKAFDFSRTTIAVMLLLMLLAGSLVAYATRENLRDFVRERWRSVLMWESLFLVAFLLIYLVRLANPDIWHPARGGEKPMDFAYLNAVIRSTEMPPYDPWFSGAYINYYYFGQFLTATMIKLTGILPEVGYNLAVPMFFAIGVAAAYSLGFNLAETTRRFMRRRPGGGRIGPRGPVLAGLGTVFLIMCAGNLGGTRQLIDNYSKISPWHVDAPLLGGLVGLIGGVKAQLIDGQSVPLGYDWYWASSRMMPPTISITEFPFFSFLFADLHAHMMAIPFAVTALAVGAAVIINATRLTRESVQFQRWAGWGMVVVLALVVGSLRWINSWDYPPFLIAGFAAVLISERMMEGRNSWAVLGRGAIKCFVLLLLSVMLFYPFQANYQLPATGFSQMTDRETTPLHQYLAHFGIMLFMIGGFVIFMSRRAWRRMGGLRFLGTLALLFVAVSLAGIVAADRLQWFLDAAPGNFTARGLSGERFLRDVFGAIFEPAPGPKPIAGSTDAGAVHHTTPVVGFALIGLALLLVLAWQGVRRVRAIDGIQLFVFSLLAIGLLLSAAVELLTLDGDIQRMNTVFKFYLHIWLLYATAAAFGAWYVLDVVRPKVSAIRVPIPQIRFSHWYQPAFAAGVGVFLLAAVVYPIVATPQRVQDRFDNPGAIKPRTDDGMAYMLGAQFGEKGGVVNLADDYAGIQWMRDNVQGSPTIIEGVTGAGYRWGSRYTIYTGLPAVAGWDFHQRQQRPQFAGLVTNRQEDVALFYETADPAEAQDILEKYDVRYVVLGALEKLYFPGVGIDNIQSGLGGMLQRVFQSGETEIYQVAAETEFATAQ